MFGCQLDICIIAIAGDGDGIRWSGSTVGFADAHVFGEAHIAGLYNLVDI